ncbi:hypothetical protein ACFHYQ_09535 [Sphaerimonospora cavernae]|uniref:DUF2207 domain-containing protein n=1 Tax=Sphaerimonospora cavernae TaxID=1740611 RepID=A0ABV6U245_9ACTN
MNAPGGSTTNIADGSATVGVQAQTVHAVNFYEIFPGDSPERKFEVGLRFLRGGVPAKAREHIGEAVADGYVTSRSCFYLLLALLSGRTLRQVPKEDLAMLRVAQGRIVGGTDEWTEAIGVISCLLTSLQKGDVVPATVEAELNRLGQVQRDEIQQNLEMFLNGSIQDDLWARAFESARKDRCDQRRLDRIWKFFQPSPAGARVRRPNPEAATIGDWGRLIGASALSLAAVCFVGVLAWQHAWLSTLPALLLFGVGCYVCWRNGVEWRFLVERRRDKDRDYLAVGPKPAAAQRGFAGKIDRQFDHYFARYVPRNTERAQWLAHTAGIRRTLRDEVVDIYRESRTDAEKVAWLVRYLVSDVRQRWERGTLWDYRDRLRVAPSTKGLFVLGVAASTAGGATMIWAALQVQPFHAVVAAVIVAAAGRVAALGWLRIVLEHRRFAAEQEDARRSLAGREAAFERWTAKLADRPSDLEMAHWLDCDRKALMEEAMGHYKLKPSDVVAHAFIEAPGKSYKRARVSKGPWRYTRYSLLIFLLTADGVRQMTADLDFVEASFHDKGRINYRYDAIAAVHATEADDGGRSFELTLVNGEPIKVKMIEALQAVAEPGEDERSVSRVTLDAAGLGNTLHVLEGVAAEGKEWIGHERKREEDGLAALADAVQGISPRYE